MKASKPLSLREFLTMNVGGPDYGPRVAREGTIDQMRDALSTKKFSVSEEKEILKSAVENTNSGVFYVALKDIHKIREDLQKEEAQKILSSKSFGAAAEEIQVQAKALTNEFKELLKEVYAYAQFKHNTQVMKLITSFIASTLKVSEEEKSELIAKLEEDTLNTIHQETRIKSDKEESTMANVKLYMEHKIAIKAKKTLDDERFETVDTSDEEETIPVADPEISKAIEMAMFNWSVAQMDPTAALTGDVTTELAEDAL